MAKSAAVKEEKIKARVKANQKKEKAAKKDKAPKKEKHETNEVGIRKGTVLETIFNCLKKGATVADILEACTKAHPDRNSESMEKTIRLQLFRMPKEKGFTLKKTDSEDGGKVYKIDKIDPSIKEKAKAESKKKKDKKAKKAKKAEVEEEVDEDDEDEDEDDED